MVAMDRVRLAVVGLGRWAGVLARAASRGDVIEVASCLSRSEDTRSAFQAEFGVRRAASSYQELLADDEIEGIVVTTPNDTHKAFIIPAVEAGVAVFTEKPIAHTLRDAFEIAHAVEDAGVVFAVGHSARRLAGHRVMKSWIDEGRLGGVSLTEANFTTPSGLGLTPEMWRWYASNSPGGPLIQLGVHHADTLQYLLGPVQTVTARARRLYTHSEVPDAVMSVLEFESGPLGYLGTGWASPGVYTMKLLGTKMNLSYEVDLTYWSEAHRTDDHSSLHSQSPQEGGHSAVELPRSDASREQLEEFALAIRGRARVEVGVAEAIRALAVVHAALESSNRAGAAVALRDVLEEAQAAAAGGA